MLSSVGAQEMGLCACPRSLSLSGGMNTVIFFVVRLRWKWVNVITEYVCVSIRPHRAVINEETAFVNGRRACSLKKERRRFRDRQEFLFVVC